MHVYPTKKLTEAGREIARLTDINETMLAALKRLLASVDPGNSDSHSEGCGCVIHEARAAITKAEPF